MTQLQNNIDNMKSLESVLITGDLESLSAEERLQYYSKICDCLGLNPLTRPFDYLKFNGKTILYARRDCADQLRKLYGIQIKIITQVEDEGILTIHVAAQDKFGRHDEDIGAVNIAGLRGEARANAKMKALTKAKRRVTLSLCGLGILDETEADDIDKNTNVSFDLDKLFSKEKEALEKNSVLEKPEIVEEVLLDSNPPNEQQSSPEGNTANDRPYELVLGDKETIKYESSVEFYDEYKNQLKNIFNNETIEPRQRMTDMKKLGLDNQKVFKLLPNSAQEELKKLRLDLNKKLGVKK